MILFLSLVQAFLLGAPDRSQAREQLERSIKGCCAVVEALGPKPLTGRMGLWWEVVTTVLYFNVLEKRGTMTSFHFSVRMEPGHILSLISWTCRSLKTSKPTSTFSCTAARD